MNFRKLKIFYETAINLNMSKVAKSMYISQPSVSQSIQELEEELQCKLFDRIGKKLHLTYEGELFLNYTRRILNLYSEGVESIKNISKEYKGRIVIGASTTIGIYILPEIIKKFSRDYPEIEISLIIENTEHIEKLLLENMIDFAFIEGTVTAEEINKEVMWEDEIVFICGDKHRLNGIDIIKGKELLNEKLIMREKGSGTREYVQKFLNNNLESHNIFLELGNSEAIKRTVRANLGVGCISKMCVEEEIRENKLHIFSLEEGKIKRELLLIVHKDKFIGNNMKVFIEFAKRNNI